MFLGASPPRLFSFQAETERQLIEGGSDMLQLMNLLAFCMRTFAAPKN